MSAPRCTQRLAARAEPGSATADARLRDRRAAPPTRLSVAPVHAELVLHRAGSAVWRGVVAQRRTLALDPGAERCADRAREPGDLLGRQPVRGPQRVEPRAPERLVRVDVPEPRDDPLVEEHRLERRLPPRELRASQLAVKREPSGSGPFFAARYGSSSTPSSTSQVPNRRTSRYPSRPPSSSSMTARSCETGAKPKLPVIRRWTSSPSPLSSRTRRYFPRRSTATTRSPSSSSATSNRSCGRVSRGSRISTRANVRPSRRGASCARIVSTSGSSGIAATRRRRAGSRARAAAGLRSRTRD